MEATDMSKNLHVYNATIVTDKDGETLLGEHVDTPADPRSEAFEMLWETVQPLLPKIELPGEGMTGYLDYLALEDLKGSPAVCGLDPVGRPFIAFRYESEGKTPCVLVVHRRYVSGSLWVIAGRARPFGDMRSEEQTANFFFAFSEILAKMGE